MQPQFYLLGINLIMQEKDYKDYFQAGEHSLQWET